MINHRYDKNGFVQILWVLGQTTILFLYGFNPEPVFASGQNPSHGLRHQLYPLPDQQVSFQIDGIEKTRWHFGKAYPRPFFYPFNGPSGVSLTRMGYPGAPNHDHHRSIWFAHHSVNEIDFWSDNTSGSIYQKMWLAYCDGDNESIMAVLLEWTDSDGIVAMEQQLIAAQWYCSSANIINRFFSEHLLKLFSILSWEGSIRVIDAGDADVPITG